MTGNGTSSLIFSGSIANLNTALNGLIYTPTNGFTGSDSLQVSINDEGNTGTGGTDGKCQREPHGQRPAVDTTGGTSLAFTSRIRQPSLTAISIIGAGSTLSGATVAITGNFGGPRRVELCQHGYYHRFVQYVDRRVDSVRD